MRMNSAMWFPQHSSYSQRNGTNKKSSTSSAILRERKREGGRERRRGYSGYKTLKFFLCQQPSFEQGSESDIVYLGCNALYHLMLFPWSNKLGKGTIETHGQNMCIPQTDHRRCYSSTSLALCSHTKPNMLDSFQNGAQFKFVLCDSPNKTHMANKLVSVSA